MRWKPQVFSPCNFPCSLEHRAWADGDAALPPHVCTYFCLCCKMNSCYDFPNLCLYSRVFYALLSSFLLMKPSWHCATFQPVSAETGEESEVNLNITDNNSLILARDTLPLTTPPIPLQLWSWGPGWWSLCPPPHTHTLREDRNIPWTPLYPASLHTHHPSARHPCLVPAI